MFVRIPEHVYRVLLCLGVPLYVKYQWQQQHRVLFGRAYDNGLRRPRYRYNNAPLRSEAARLRRRSLLIYGRHTIQYASCPYNIIKYHCTRVRTRMIMLHFKTRNGTYVRACARVFLSTARIRPEPRLCLDLFRSPKITRKHYNVQRVSFYSFLVSSQNRAKNGSRRSIIITLITLCVKTLVT